MTRHVLGISCHYHDAAAALVRDDEIVAAAQEERFTRKKHDPRYPRQAVDYCLGEAGLEPEDLDLVVYHDNPILTTDRIVRSLLHVAPKGAEEWARASRTLLGHKLPVESTIRDHLAADVPVRFSEHHFSHAASAYHPSPFDEAAILTVDGVGEWATTTIGKGRGDDLEILEQIEFPHSLGLLYAAFTYHCGFKVNSGEYKLMGLAAYGEPEYEEQIRRHLIDLKPDGSFRLNLKHFGFLDSDRMTTDSFEDLFGGPAREPESTITKRECNLAASIQRVTEDAILRLARYARRRTGIRNLVMAGGVALNCVANGRVVREGVFDDVWIQPAAGDAGGALGAALHAAHAYLGVPRSPRTPGRDAQKGSFLGPGFSNAEIRAFLDAGDHPYATVTDEERSRVVADALASGKIVGYMVGRMEFGPRALGARSILGDPRDPRCQTQMNLKIKFRESFRPFAPSVLESRSTEYFDLDATSPYMLLVAPLQDHRRLDGDGSANGDVYERVRQIRSDIPAVTHVDHSARVQTIDAEAKPDYADVVRAFEQQTGCGLVVNTSFNVRGEPIVCTPKDAYTCFMRTDMDLLVMENCVLRKEDQPHFEEDTDWRQEYELD